MRPTYGPVDVTEDTRILKAPTWGSGAAQLTVSALGALGQSPRRCAEPKASTVASTSSADPPRPGGDNLVEGFSGTRGRMASRASISTSTRWTSLFVAAHDSPRPRSERQVDAFGRTQLQWVSGAGLVPRCPRRLAEVMARKRMLGPNVERIFAPKIGPELSVRRWTAREGMGSTELTD